MTNDSPLRPSVLGQNSQTSPFNLSELKEIISEIVRNENQQMLGQLSNTNTPSPTESDETIDARHAQNLDGLDKIPDVVKSLRDFSGNPGEFGSWKKSVERILKIYESIKGTPKYYGILSVIRNKITGQADTALESYNTPLNWEKISRCLTLHYADKRDIGTLEYQMTTLIQRNQTIHEFYQQVYYHLSLILNKLSSMEMSQDALNAMTQSYRGKALDTFIRGLKGDLPRLLSIRGPHDLPEALHLCLKLENVNYRIQHSHGNFRASQPHLPPPIPPKKPNIPLQRHQNTPHSFYPHLLHNPRPPQTPFRHHGPPSPFFQQRPPNFQNNFTRPKFQNNFPRPEPMDVDQSTRSRQVNYMNRPSQPAYAQKRTGSHQIHQPTKFQRVNHVTQETTDPEAEYHQEMLEQDEFHEQTFVEYTNSQHSVEPEDYEGIETLHEEQPEEPDEIYFLD